LVLSEAEDGASAVRGTTHPDPPTEESEGRGGTPRENKLAGREEEKETWYKRTPERIPLVCDQPLSVICVARCRARLSRVNF
ncbi:unnamed protein product, partial [Musa acuminata var. zebrina]